MDAMKYVCYFTCLLDYNATLLPWVGQIEHDATNAITWPSVRENKIAMCLHLCGCVLCIFHWRSSSFSLIIIIKILLENWNKKKLILRKQKGKGPTILVGLPAATYSQVRSHYCPTRGLLPAASRPWACASLLRRPGDPGLPRGHHIDARLSADTRST